METEKNTLKIQSTKEIENLLRSSNIYLFGAGSLAKNIYKNLKNIGIDVKGFVVDDKYYNDNNEYIVSLSTYKSLSKQDHLLIVSVCNFNFSYINFRNSNPHLKLLHFGVLNLFLHDYFGDYYILSDFNFLKRNFSRIDGLLKLLQHSPLSLDTLNLQFNIRSELNFDNSQPNNLNFYLPDFIKEMINDEFIFIDAGMYVGDTIQEMINKHNFHFKKIIGFEPDVNNIEKAKKNLEKETQIFYINKAVSNFNGVAKFNQTSSEESSLSNNGALMVETIKLDDWIESENTFVKFDIEGEEINAIYGMKNAIEKYKPLLAISAYHKPEHLWEIPELVLQINPNYKTELRQEGNDGMGLIYYFF